MVPKFFQKTFEVGSFGATYSQMLISRKGTNPKFAPTNTLREEEILQMYGKRNVMIFSGTLDDSSDPSSSRTF